MIRRLTDVKHIPRLLEYGKKWHGKSSYAHLAFSYERSKATLKAAMLSPGSVVFAAFDEEKLCGALVGMIVEFPWFEESFATDLIFMADKYGDRLFATFAKWARKHTKHIQMGVTSGLGTADKFYQAIGMKQIGGIYVGELE